jgi:hypothetical protein
VKLEQHSVRTTAAGVRFTRRTTYCAERDLKWNQELDVQTGTDEHGVTCVICIGFRKCGCETWSVTLSEERRLRVFENRVLRRMFGPNREKVAGDWRRLHIEELHNL